MLRRNKITAIVLTTTLTISSVPSSLVFALDTDKRENLTYSKEDTSSNADILEVQNKESSNVNLKISNISNDVDRVRILIKGTGSNKYLAHKDIENSKNTIDLGFDIPVDDTYTVRVIGFKKSGTYPNVSYGAEIKDIQVRGDSIVNENIELEKVVTTLSETTPSQVKVGENVVIKINIYDPANFLDGVRNGRIYWNEGTGETQKSYPIRKVSDKNYELSATVTAPIKAGTVKYYFGESNSEFGILGEAPFIESQIFNLDILDDETNLTINVSDIPKDIDKLRVLIKESNTNKHLMTEDLNTENDTRRLDLSVPKSGIYNIRVIGYTKNGSTTRMAYGGEIKSVSIDKDTLTNTSVALEKATATLSQSTPSEVTAGDKFEVTVDIYDPANFYDGVNRGRIYWNQGNGFNQQNYDLVKVSDKNYRLKATMNAPIKPVEIRYYFQEFSSEYATPGESPFFQSDTFAINVKEGTPSLNLSVSNIPLEAEKLRVLITGTKNNSYIFDEAISGGSTSKDIELALPEEDYYNVKVIGINKDKTYPAVICGTEIKNIHISKGNLVRLNAELEKATTQLDENTPSEVRPGENVNIKVNIYDPANFFEGRSKGRLWWNEGSGYKQSSYKIIKISDKNYIFEAEKLAPITPGVVSYYFGEYNSNFELTGAGGVPYLYSDRFKLSVGSSNNKLSNLALEDENKAYSITPEFSPEIENYSVAVPNEVDNLTIKGNSEDLRASIDGLGKKEILAGENKFNIVVTAENKETKTYTLKINKKPKTPTAEKFTTKDTILNGKADPENIIIVKSGETEIARTISDVDGRFSVNIGKHEESSKLTLIAVDKYQIESISQEVVVMSNEDPVIVASDRVLKVDDKFNPLENVSANDKEDGDITSEIKVIENTVDIKVPGLYKVVYEVTDTDNNTTTKEIEVKVNQRLSTMNNVPTITAENVELKVGDEFNPLENVSANDKEDGDITSSIEIVRNTVNVTEVGEYEVVYKVEDSQGASTTKTIKVKVRSNYKPVINAIDKTLRVGDEFNPLQNVTAIDIEDGVLTPKLIILENTVNTEVAGEYKVVYSVLDSDNNTTTKEIKVKVNPRLSTMNNVPTITAEDRVLKVGDEFNPLENVSANDKEDGDITSSIEIVKNTVNITEAGEYEVVYKVEDSQGASTTKTIKVKVNPRLSTMNNVPIITAENVELKVGDEFNPLENVSANDKEDGDITSSIEIVKNTVNVTEAGEYEVVYKVEDSQGASTTKTIKVKVRSNYKPVINAMDKTLRVGDEFNPLQNVTAIDIEDGVLTPKLIILENTVNTEVAGEYKVVYSVLDSDHNTTTKEIKVKVNPRLSTMNNVPTITAENVELKVGDGFNPLENVSANDKEDGDITSSIEIVKNTVNVTEAGEYEVVYKVEDSQGASTTKTIKVKVNPRLSTMNNVPTITAENVELKVGDEFNPLENVSANDKEDGDITSSIEIVKNTVNITEAGEYEVVYKVEDSQGASTTKTIKVKVNPRLSTMNNVPTITAENVELKVGDEFNPLENVSANDKEDGDITSSIEIVKNTVNVTEAGEYEVVYKVEDSQGASTTKTIKVKVNPRLSTMNNVPTITAEDRVLKVGDGFNPLENVSANDKEDGDITSSIEIVKNTVNVTEAGEYEVVYKVEDSQGASTTKTIKVSIIIKEIEIIDASGSDRYSTAVEISKTQFKNADTAVIVNGEALADGLAVTPIATHKKSPILLTTKGSLPQSTKDELQRLGVKNIIIAGGVTSVNESVETQLKSIGIELIERIGGNDRYDTSLEIAKYIDENCYDVESVIISNGSGQADALSISPVAGKNRMPIILSPKDNLPSTIYNWLEQEELKNAYIVGGENSISEKNITDLNKITEDDIINNRLGGANRYETNAIIINKFYDKNLVNIYVSKGESLVDALSAGPIAALNNSPIILVNQDLSKGQLEALEGKSADKIIKAGGSIPEKAITSILEKIK